MKFIQTTRRLVAPAAALALTAGLVATTGSTAQAGVQATTPVQIEIAQPRYPVQTIGSSLSLNGNMTTSTGAAARTNNAIYLQRRANGSSTWVNVSSDADGGGLYFDTQKFSGNAQYRAYFPGGADRYNSSVVYSAAYSNVVTVKTLRKISGKVVYGRNSLHFKGKIAPKSKKKAKVQIKKGGWKTVRKVKLKKGKKFNFRISGPDNRKVRVVFPGDKRFAKTSTRDYTIY